VCVDDHSCLVYIELLAERKAATANQVMTDNSSDYRQHLFLTVCHSLGAKPIKTKPYPPRTNGKVKRFSRLALENVTINNFTSPQTSESLLFYLDS
jgi:transposase InsO family protein